MTDPKASGSQKKASGAVCKILSNTPEEMNDPSQSPGRRQLQKWLGRPMKLVLTDGRILIGVFSCTDPQMNIVLTQVKVHSVEGGKSRALPIVTVARKHIVSICIEGN
ncbi:N-alpha-acetyltransferase 38, NatC auxiliary subunit-like [Drosophila obscura]|uniref:N-alpha-acetyltransferase 38, NatC auxiliary subunit-like n=1 Tax=Drosophila obscura TaxID=7282 RepID=UPI000B9FF425|nr:N-alpha-acetyltransferase 38, NatC auxiliary subunit-like [Drosophila obscura]